MTGWFGFFSSYGVGFAGHGAAVGQQQGEKIYRNVFAAFNAAAGLFEDRVHLRSLVGLHVGQRFGYAIRCHVGAK